MSETTKRGRPAHRIPPKSADMLLMLRLLTKVTNDAKTRKQLVATVRAFLDAGWTLASVADACHVTRQTVFNWKQESEALDITKLVAMDVPPFVSSSPAKVERKPKAMLSEADVKELLMLHDIAKRNRRGRVGTQSFTAECSQRFTDMVWNLHNDKGVSIYAIAKAVGVTVAALQFRLVRYGYKTTTGKSKSYQPMQRLSA